MLKKKKLAARMLLKGWDICAASLEYSVWNQVDPVDQVVEWNQADDMDGAHLLYPEHHMEQCGDIVAAGRH